MKYLVTVLLLAFALAGCSTIHKWTEPASKPTVSTNERVVVTPPVSKALATKPPVDKPLATGATAAESSFNPGVLSPEQQAQNLKKCEGWEKLSVAEKRKRDFFCWQHVGADPYQGTPEAALAQSGWPIEVRKLFLGQIRQGTKAEMVLERGMTFDWSTYGRGVSKAFTHHNVVTAWKEGEIHRASVYTASNGGKIYKLYLPRDCANWSGNVYTIPVQTVVAPPSATLCPDGVSVTYWSWNNDQLETVSPERAAGVRQYADRDKTAAAFLGRDMGDTPAAKYGRYLRDNISSGIGFPAPMTLQLQQGEIRNGVITPVAKIGEPVQVSGRNTWNLSGVANLSGKVVAIELPPKVVLDGKDFKPLWPTSQKDKDGKDRNFVFVRGSSILTAKSCNFNIHGFFTAK
ncbi:MAG: hypothetical protein Q7S34_00935 [bacterium]|nr:hypothetical protein [bacterium]